MLRRVLSKSRDYQKRPQIVMLAGGSGTGKTALISKAFHNSNKCLYGVGEFEQETQSHTKTPYTALMHCLSHICREMIHHDYNTIINDPDSNQINVIYASRIRDQIKKEEIARLSTFIPELAQLLALDGDGDEGGNDHCNGDGCDIDTATISQTGTISPKRIVAANSNPLKYAIKCFLQAISIPERPLVLCMDNLQWMDQGSLEIIQSILADKRLYNMIFAGTYRDDEVTPGHRLIEFVKTFDVINVDAVEDSLLEKSPSSKDMNAQKVSIMTVNVDDLGVDVVESLLSDILNVEGEDIKMLAEVIHTRTNGNIFHVLKLIDYLQDHELLRYSIGHLRWSWDIGQIIDETSLSDNVVAIMGFRLRNLPKQVQTCMRLCSCLGTRFDENVIIEIQGLLHGPEAEERGDVQLSLSIASDAGLIEQLWGNDHRSFKFAHDKIFEAALQLFSNEDERNETHFAIGQILWANHFGRYLDSPAGVDEIPFLDDRYLFLCADQLNRGRKYISDGSFLTKLAELNWLAAQRAAAKSAFFPAVTLLEVGVGFLDPDRSWEDNYDLSLKLYTSLAEMSSKAGKTEKQNLAIEAVLKNAKSVEDSIQVRLVDLEHRFAQQAHEEHITVSLNVLNLLGEKIPEHPANLYKQWTFRQTKLKVLTLTDEAVRTLPVMNDKKIEAAIQILASLAQPAYNVGNHNLSTVCVCRAVQLTVKHGIAPHSPFAMSWLSTMAISEQDDVDAAYKFCKMLTPMREILTSLEPNGRDAAISASVVQWREPLSHVLEMSMKGHRDGMRSGDMFSAFLNVTVYGYSFYLSGLPIEPLVRDMEDYIDLMMEYNHKVWVLINLPVYQTVLNLAGRTPNVLDLNKTNEYRARLGWENRTGEETEWSYRMQTAFYCEDFKLATDLADRLMAVPPGQARTFPYYQTRVFFFVLIALWNTSNATSSSPKSGGSATKQKYKLIAKKYYGLIKGWVVKKRAINMVHKLQILEAEMKSMDKKIHPKEVMASYDEAIAASTKSGFLQDAALAAHLASRSVKDKEAKKRYFERALSLYSSWGAIGIVEYLCENTAAGQVSSVVMPSSTTRGGGERSKGVGAAATGNSSSSLGGFRSRPRYDRRLSEQHKSLRRVSMTSQGSLSSSNNNSGFLAAAAAAATTTISGMVAFGGSSQDLLSTSTHNF